MDIEVYIENLWLAENAEGIDYVILNCLGRGRGSK